MVNAMYIMLLLRESILFCFPLSRYLVYAPMSRGTVNHAVGYRISEMEIRTFASKTGELVTAPPPMEDILTRVGGKILNYVAP